MGERSLFGIGKKHMHFVGSESACFLQFCKFIIKRRIGNRHVVGIDGNLKTGRQELPERKCIKRRENPGLDIACRAELQRNLLLA